MKKIDIFSLSRLRGKLKMKKGIIFLLALMMIPLALASNTQVNVQADRNSEILLTALDPNTGDTVQSMTNLTDDYGIAKFTLDVGLARVNFSVVVRQNGKIVGGVVKFPTYSTGQTITLDLDAQVEAENTSVANETEAVNETINSTEDITNETTDVFVAEDASNGTIEEGATTGTGKITGNAILGVADNGSLLIVGIIILVVIISFLGYKFLLPRFKRDTTPTTFRTIKLSEIPRNQEEATGDLASAERKLQEAMVEINRIKNQDKIKQAEQKLEQDRAELERLKRGY